MEERDGTPASSAPALPAAPPGIVAVPLQLECALLLVDLVRTGLRSRGGLVAESLRLRPPPAVLSRPISGGRLCAQTRNRSRSKER